MILQETSTATEPGCCIMIGQYMYGKIDAFHKQLIYQASIIEKCMMSTMQKPFSKPKDREKF